MEVRGAKGMAGRGGGGEGERGNETWVWEEEEKFM